jgi:hypothetical protein
LRASLPRGLRRRRPRRRYPLAIDRHGVPYYKRGQAPPAHVRTGRRLPGTGSRHPYATACLLRTGQYYTVALTPYGPDENLAAVVRRLLQQAARNGFTPRYVLMDRSFWSADVFRYLHAGALSVLAPGRGPGPEADHPGRPDGGASVLALPPDGPVHLPRG